MKALIKETPQHHREPVLIRFLEHPHRQLQDWMLWVAAAPTALSFRLGLVCENPCPKRPAL